MSDVGRLKFKLMGENFPVGTIVRLKSGGPEMTVNGYLNSGQCVCSWFDKNQIACKENFYPDALEKIEK